MRIVSQRIGKVCAKKLKEKKNFPTKKDGRKDIDKIRIILTMFYSDGLI